MRLFSPTLGFHGVARYTQYFGGIADTFYPDPILRRLRPLDETP